VVRCKALKLPIVDYSLPIPKLDKRFVKELNNAKLDIVHIHSPFTVGKIGINYAKQNNIPVIGTMHSQYKLDFLRAVKFNSIANMLTKVVIKQYNRCDECWAVNEQIANIYYKEYHYKELPKVMNNATDMKPVDDIKKAKELINSKYNINPNEKVFLFVGRINNLKNVFFIANTLKILKEKCNFKFKMLFVGNGQDEEELKKIIKNNNMENDIIMCGKMTDRNILADYYARADLFLFPSLYDSSSIVQIEAASQKTPTVFIEGAVTASAIENNVNGFISANNEESFANKIIEIMNNTDLYDKVCENAFKEVYVNWDQKIKEIYEIYVSKRS
jgi:glycosyltransferase involved in cell wall biosynthesis